MGKHILYSNYMETDEEGKDAFDYAKEDLFEQEAEDNGWKSPDDIPENEIRDMVHDRERWDWDDFEQEFKIFLAENGPFMLRGTVGRWNGTKSVGKVIKDFNELSRFWDDCDYIKVYDENGHLFVECSHHDADNFAELKRITQKGQEFLERHEWDDMPLQEMHDKVMTSNFYSGLPNYAHRVWGCKKYA